MFAQEKESSRSQYEGTGLGLTIAKCMLENSGMKVTCTADGQEAVELFEKSEPGYYGAIFMNVMMPRIAS